MRNNYFSAGMGGYMILVPFQNNPYKNEPARTQWAKGWKFAQKQNNMKRRVYKKNT